MLRGLLAGLDEAGLVGEHDSLGPVRQAELGQDMGDVGLDRGLGDEQGGGDGAVGLAAADKSQHLELPRGQAGQLGGRLAGGRLAAEPLDEPAGNYRGEQGVPGDCGTDGVRQLAAAHVLEQESAGPGLHRPIDEFVAVEDGQHEDPGRRGLSHDGPGSRQAVHARHADVHQDHIGFQGPGQLNGLAAGGRVGDDLDIALKFGDRPQAVAYQGLVVSDQDPDLVAHLTAPTATGNRACTRNPRCSPGPAASWPWYSATRSRIPASPCPPAGELPPHAARGPPGPLSMISTSSHSGVRVTVTTARQGRPACLMTLVRASWITRYAAWLRSAGSEPGAASTCRSTGTPVACTWAARAGRAGRPGMGGSGEAVASPSSPTTRRSSARACRAVLSTARRRLLAPAASSWSS